MVKDPVQHILHDGNGGEGVDLRDRGLVAGVDDLLGVEESSGKD